MLNDKNEAIIHQEPNRFNKPNILVRVALDKILTTKEKKIQNFFIRELLQLNQEEYKSNEINTSVSAIVKHLGVKNRSELYQCLDTLSNTTIKFIDSKDRTLTRAKVISGYTRPLCTLLDGLEPCNETKDNLIIRFDTYLTKVILKYSENYAKLDLNDIAKLRITHSITLYENFIKSLGKYTTQLKNISEEELRTLLNLQDKYLDTRVFTQKVIKKCTKEINEKTKIHITFLKRVKIDGMNIYKFKIEQAYKWQFNKFKKCLVENFRTNSFTFKNGEYLFTRREENNTKDLEFLISNAKTYKTISSDLAQGIYQTLYQMAQENINLFIFNFVLNREITKDNNFNDLKFMEDISNIEEVSDFMFKYENTKV